MAVNKIEFDESKPRVTKGNYNPNPPFDPYSWVASDCYVKRCEDGLIHEEDDDGYSKVYRCPGCNRSQVAAAKYKGQLEYWTPEEMARREDERKEIASNKEYRKKRGKELIQFLGSLIGEAKA